MRRIAAGGRLDLIIIDYLQLLASSDPRANEYQRITAATAAIKAMAISQEVPVLLLAQLNREGTRPGRTEGKVDAQPEPRLADLRGSSSIENDSDAVVALWRRDTVESDNRPTTACVLKNRQGKIRQIDLMFNGPRQEFTSISPEKSRIATQPSSTEDLYKESNP